MSDTATAPSAASDPTPATPDRQQILHSLTQSGPFELTIDESAGYPLRVYKHAPPSLRAVLEATAAQGDKPFLVYGDEVISYAEHLRRVGALARHLLAHGVRKGDRVAIGMRNYPEWSVGFWACQAIGAVVVALNAWWITAELEFALEDSQPSAFIVDGERLERLRSLIKGVREETLVVVRRGDAGPGGIDLTEILGGDGGLPDADIGPTDLATILYTSGTTGKPKGAMATHRNHLTNLTNGLLSGALARVMMGLPADAQPDPAAPQPGMLQTFPLFHIGGLSGLLACTAMGTRMALMYKWSPAEAIQLVQDHRLSSVAGVPIVVRQLLEAAAASGATLDSLLGISSGGAPVPPDLIRTIGSQFQARTAAGNGYGLTETTSAVIVNGGADYFARPDSVGRPVVCAEIRVVDDDGRDLPGGQIGELWVRGPNVIPGYWGNPEATEAAFGGGWFRTGDLGYVDPEGFYYVVDRKKDVIIRGGENVYCAEVEAALLEHPRVRDAAVIGLPHPEYGEEVAAVIRIDPEDSGQDLADDLRTALADKLARFKIPSAIRTTSEELPRTATGKVLKQQLRLAFAEARA
ncbi:class I adenylate-forming enzyme family protein [uncultured Phenylobacterium sp.]|uniref:class I adenylate-forming enzyme family protein n=1 Tax=uncultured Phenylobacterium sp. TaxID=349273 RepID=UPI0025D13449|nr:class I adenylate-forming enzyme family protein [uncultured Phenylobacterium sp.]